MVRWSSQYKLVGLLTMGADRAFPSGWIHGINVSSPWSEPPSRGTKPSELVLSTPHGLGLFFFFFKKQSFSSAVTLVLFFKFLLKIFLAVPCSMQDLSFPGQGLNFCPLQWNCRVLTSGPPGKSSVGSFITTITIRSYRSAMWGSRNV